jgi:phage repressor protein C with HTH and peptisase S24 domain
MSKKNPGCANIAFMPTKPDDGIVVQGEVIRAMRDQWDKSQAKFGKLIGMSREWVVMTEKSGARRIRRETLEGIAKAMGVDSSAAIRELRIADDMGPEKRAKSGFTFSGPALKLAEEPDLRQEMDSDFVPLRGIPFFDFKVPASGWADGCEGRRADEADGYVEVPADAPRDAFAFRIRGDCMIPTFPDGAIVVCVPVRPGDNGEQFTGGKPYYCVNVANKCTFKNVYYEPPKERYRLESLNKKYRPFHLPVQEMARMSRAIKVVIDL